MYRWRSPRRELHAQCIVNVVQRNTAEKFLYIYFLRGAVLYRACLSRETAYIGLRLHGLYILPLQIAPENTKLDRTVFKSFLYLQESKYSYFFSKEEPVRAGAKVAQGRPNPLGVFYFFA
jgi:hypothetical protein